MEWEVQPELERDVQEALVAAVERELAAERDGESIWWRSGLEDLNGGPTSQQPWSDSGVIET